eukprot:scaffold242698_cov32-Tisochrysis_lutea.AAC.2
MTAAFERKPCASAKSVAVSQACRATAQCGGPACVADGKALAYSSAQSPTSWRSHPLYRTI